MYNHIIQHCSQFEIELLWQCISKARGNKAIYKVALINEWAEIDILAKRLCDGQTDKQTENWRDGLNDQPTKKRLKGPFNAHGARKSP